MKKTTRRSFLVVAGSALAAPAFAETTVDLPIPGGPQERAITKAFPQKGPMILQRTRPPLLETPFEVFDKGVFTPNDQFFVRWHWAVIPTEIDVASFRLSVNSISPCATSSTACRGSSWPPSTSVRATRAASPNHGSRARNGPTAPWAMPSGWACG